MIKRSAEQPDFEEGVEMISPEIFDSNQEFIGFKGLILNQSIAMRNESSIVSLFRKSKV